MRLILFREYVNSGQIDGHDMELSEKEFNNNRFLRLAVIKYILLLYPFLVRVHNKKGDLIGVMANEDSGEKEVFMVDGLNLDLHIISERVIFRYRTRY